jgi:alkanesulfonate monooxygenase SsuD/methylene tetrahydromethanopterin reductase-like flavin-dependent oxidoreductase (luciferase family)
MTSDRPFEIGLFTFGEITADPATGRPLDPASRLREFIDLAVLADQAGLDVFGVGEHHRPDFAIASPPVVLAAIAQATEQIRLTSTVTVLSTADPVKVFEDFTAVDLISGGRAEITAGRGAYTESFRLFGHDRFLAQIGLGGLPFAYTARSIELLATEVLPVIHRETRTDPLTALAGATSPTNGGHAP